MNDQERAINHDLKVLGDAYRLGQIPREEYRLRRRRVLTEVQRSTGNRGRDPLIAERTDRTSRKLPAASASAAMDGRTALPGSGSAQKYWLLFAVSVAILAALWFSLR